MKKNKDNKLTTMTTIKSNTILHKSIDNCLAGLDDFVVVPPLDDRGPVGRSQTVSGGLEDVLTDEKPVDVPHRVVINDALVGPPLSDAGKLKPNAKVKRKKIKIELCSEPKYELLYCNNLKITFII